MVPLAPICARSIVSSTSTSASVSASFYLQASCSTSRTTPNRPLRNSSTPLHQYLPPCLHRQRCRSLHTTPARGDYYGVLEVGREASKKDIKAQFYKLSKRYHPDMHAGAGAESAKRRFQEVSEAWSTLGDDRSRREYDRRLSSSSETHTGHSYAYRHDTSDNITRRARATYAWEYQRRRGDSPRARRAASYHQHGGASAGAGPAPEAPPGASSSAMDRSLFEHLAAQQRRREAAASARAESRTSGMAPGTSAAGAAGGTSAVGGGSGSSSSKIEENVENDSSSLMRFLQIAGIFSFVLWVGMRASSSGSDGVGRLRRVVKNDEGAKRCEERERGKRKVAVLDHTRQESVCRDAIS